MSIEKIPLPDKLGRLMDKGFDYNIRDYFHKYKPGNIVLNKEFGDVLPRLQEFQCRPDDVWLTSYAKTGSHWILEITWLIGNDCNFEEAAKIPMQLRCPFIESYAYFWEYEEAFKKIAPEAYDPITYADKLTGRRFIKTHLTYPLLPKSFDKVKPKLLITLRDPRDVYTSMYPFLCTFVSMALTPEEFEEIFFSGYCILSDLVEYYLDCWSRRDDPNILIIMYEDMKKKPVENIKRIAKFIEKDISDENIQKIIEFTSPENMKKIGGFLDKLLKEFKPEVDLSKHGFIRKAKVGSWREELSPRLIKRFEEYMKPLTEAGLTFD